MASPAQRLQRFRAMVWVNWASSGSFPTRLALESEPKPEHVTVKVAQISVSMAFCRSLKRPYFGVLLDPLKEEFNLTASNK
jgi:hypothetical protein